MIVVFVRHGESEGNVAGIINDDPRRHVGLTERGQRQAEAAGSALRHRLFSHAFVSEFPRAQQTARAILRHHQCMLEIDAQLNERRSGMDGMPVDSFNVPARRDPLRFRPPLGESFLEEVERLRAFLRDVERLASDAHVLAVSHQDPILAAQVVAGADPETTVLAAIRNCGQVTLEFGAGMWRVAAADVD
jgi:broad specificity phosphatase PhoE